MSFVLIALCQPGGAAINFSNSILFMNQSNFESKENHSSKMVQPKQISFAEVGGNKRFF